MKNKKIITILTIVLSLILIISLILISNRESEKFSKKKYSCEYNNKYYEIDNERDKNYFFSLKYKAFDSLEPLKLYYTDSKELQNYYLYCLDEIFINLENESITLQEGLTEGKISLEDIMRRLTYGVSFFDGGTSHHTDKAIHSGFGIALVKCNKIEGTQDIYIGPIYMNYEETFCQQ